MPKMFATAKVWINEDDPPKLLVSAPYSSEFIMDLRNRKIDRTWDKGTKVYKLDLFYTKEVVDCLHSHFQEVIKTPSVGMYYLFSFLDMSDIEDVYRVLAKKHRDGDMRKLLDSLFGRFWQLEKTMDTPRFRQFRFDGESENAMSPLEESSNEIRQMMDQVRPPPPRRRPGPRLSSMEIREIFIEEMDRLRDDIAVESSDEGPRGPSGADVLF